MADTQQTVVRETRGGIPGILDEETGRWFPIMTGAEEPDTDPDPSDDPNSDPDPAEDPIDDSDSSDAPREPDWKAQSRKHERERKKLAKERDELAARLREREDADKTEQEKALEEARVQARDEALSEARRDRRADRLETAVVRLAARGIEVETPDGRKTLRFDDPEDALVFIERQLNRGDLDADDVFGDNDRVNADTVSEALADLLARKPRLAADGGRARIEDPGDIDAGRGTAKDPDDLNVEGHLAAVRRRK